MIRTPVALVGALLTAVLVFPAAPAAAAATCDGKTATIVGSRGAFVRGTNRADVIVSNGADHVMGLDGSDRICMTGTPTDDFIAVNAGYGHDRVFIRTAVRRHVFADLGHGDDLYIGGPGQDYVDAGPGGYNPDVGPRDAGLDRIATGPGADHVTVGQANLPTRDVVRLGRHSDNLTVIGLGGRGHVFDGNDGRDGLHQSWSEGSNSVVPQQRLAFDNSDEVARMNGEIVLRWDSFQNFSVEHHPAGVSFSGSRRPESIFASRLASAAMGGGDDVIRGGVNAGDGTRRGGAGRDRMVVYASGRDDITGDVEAGRIEVVGEHASAAVAFTDVEDLELHGRTVRALGDDGPNFLDGFGCTVTINGRGGDDILSSTPEEDYGDGCDNAVTIFGGSGNDRMTGGWSADELYGGTGQDYANGRGGVDLCRAEDRRNCEVQ